ncbi:hypothetical protein EMG79_06645, partial [Klebsiella pneumoniae]
METEMMFNMKSLLWIGTVCVLAGIPALYAFGSFGNGEFFGMRSFDVRETFEADGLRAIRIDGRGADVEVVRGDSEQIVVSVVGTADADTSERIDVKASVADGTLTVEPIVPDKGFFVAVFDVNVLVRLPDRAWESMDVLTSGGNVDVSSVRSAAVAVETGSGNVALADLTADALDVDAGSGNLRFGELYARDATLRIGSGNMTGIGFRAERLAFDVGSGNVRLEDGRGTLQGESRSGNIAVRFDAIEAPVVLRAGSGNVTVELAEKPEHLAFDFRTNSGESSVEWPYEAAGLVEPGEENAGAVSGRFGDGGVTLTAETGSGNI